MGGHRMLHLRGLVLGALLFTAVGCSGKGHDTKLMAASRKGDLVAVRQLIQAGEPTDARDWNGLSALHWAAKSGQTDTIRLLIKEGNARVDARDEAAQTPLHLAVKYNRVDAVKALLAAGADPNAKDFDFWTAMHFAARRGNVAVIRMLAEKGADPNALCRMDSDDERATVTPLHLAIEHDQVLAAEALRDVGAKDQLLITPDED